MPRKKIPANLRSLARGHSELCIKVLAGIASAENAPPAARVAACVAVLDRGWGRPAQSRTGEGDRDVHVIIRKFAEGGDKD